jgi:hypothetical protein
MANHSGRTGHILGDSVVKQKSPKKIVDKMKKLVFSEIIVLGRRMSWGQVG